MTAREREAVAAIRRRNGLLRIALANLVQDCNDWAQGLEETLGENPSDYTQAEVDWDRAQTIRKAANRAEQSLKIAEGRDASS